MKEFRLLSIILIISVIGITIYNLPSGSYAKDMEEKHTRSPLPSNEEIAKLPTDGGPEFNRLIFEKSPYLLQHARNPVDWNPWGEEAFEKARKEDKPVFLSIGYSTCHWCHVMEHESFEDDEVAALMNKTFVCIKVDREERPDIDDVYMTVTQSLTGSGGWPMTVVMTPDKKPFFAGTYFPNSSANGGRPGMMELVPYLGNHWKNEREKLTAQAQQITDALAQSSQRKPGKELGEDTLKACFESFQSSFDKKRGGFGNAPKFPVPHNLTFLLRYWKRTGSAEALNMVEKTLQEMRLGGIYDQIGFGFHRYSTDKDWLLPHFEKMLYDQALLAIAYLETYQATGKKEYAQTAREIFTYILRDMTSPEGGFYSAEDADSEGEEGLFYVWKPEELRSILGKEEADFFIKAYTIEKGGNFRDQATRQKTGDSIPHLKKSLSDLASQFNLSEKDLITKIEKIRKQLFTVREKRIHPFKDDKILTDWNGLMIAAMAKGGQILEDSKYTVAAQKAADFILTKLSTKNGRLLKRYRDGEAGLPAHIEDYAFVVWGLIDLYEATFTVHYLQEAIRLHNLMVKHFWDSKNGGLFMTADDGEKLLVRNKEIYDGAIPSGNSVACLNSVRLGRIMANTGYEKHAIDIMKAFSDQVSGYPKGHAQNLVALDFLLGPSFEIVLCGEENSQSTKNMLSAIHQNFVPNKVILFRGSKVQSAAITSIAPYTGSMKNMDPKATTAYVCVNFACKIPTTDTQKVLEFLSSKAR